MAFLNFSFVTTHIKSMQNPLYTHSQNKKKTQIKHTGTVTKSFKKK